MRNKWLAIGFAAVAAFVAGCHTNTVDKSAFKSALDNYYSGHQDCVWSSPQKFPAQADTSNEDQTKGFDALTDAGLLQRTSAEKKRFLVGSKQVNDYDLSDKGRSAWTADTAEPGYGNFCLGSPKVNSIDSYTAADSSQTQYSVNYHYSVSLPGWANSDEIKTAFPRVARDSDGRSASATLAKSNDGWQVQNVSAFNRAPRSLP